MALPFFYVENLDTTIASSIKLNEEPSKHIVQVLRMKIGEQLQLTDGKGNVVTCKIVDDNRKKCIVIIQKSTSQFNANITNTIAISLLKNTNRFEWFLEKSTELGINQIIPLICERTEKTFFKIERYKAILISAMLQSQQSWLPKLESPIKLEKLNTLQFANAQKFIAHCENDESKILLNSTLLNNNLSKIILIGPEGDFSNTEIKFALSNNFKPVSLGNTRLRAETAGIVAATLLING